MRDRSVRWGLLFALVMWLAPTKVTLCGPDADVTSRRAGEAIAGPTNLQTGVHVIGRIELEADKASDQAAVDWASMSVSIWKTDDDLLRRRIDVGLARNTLRPPVPIDPHGSFDIADVMPGSYYIGVNRLPRGWWLRSAISAGADVLDTSLEIRSSVQSAPSVVITLSNRRTGVTGTVTGPQTFSSYLVILFSTDKGEWHWPSRRIRVEPLEADGGFDIEDVPPGNYALGAVSGYKRGTPLTETTMAYLLSRFEPVEIVDAQLTRESVKTVVELPVRIDVPVR